MQGGSPKTLGPKTLGALVGWTRHRTGNGNIVRLECAKTLAEARSGLTEQHDVALNVRQLRALSLDLSHAADELEGRPTPHKRKWWQV